MKNLYITGTAGSGKTAVALGLAQKLRLEGYRVAYFKPVSNKITMAGKPDSDAVLMKAVLKLPYDLEQIVPYTAGPSYLSGYSDPRQALEKIMAAYREVSREADITLIDGAVYPYVLSSLRMGAAELAGLMDATILTVIKIEDDFSLDRAVFFNNYLAAMGAAAVGNIFSNVPRPLFAKTEGVFKPILEGMGYPSWGVIPCRPEIASPTVAEYQEVLNGEVLAGADRMDRLVEDVVIGAMTMVSALTYLRRSANKAVVLGGDRADLALAALETHTSVIILTGGYYPDVKVVARAAEKGVPLILVRYDTYTTVERLGLISRHIKTTDQVGIRVALENIEEHCNWQGLIGSL